MTARRAAELTGVVQGVGMRPLLSRLASELSLAGRAYNRGDAVALELEGPLEALDRFEPRLRAALPAAARLDHVCWRPLPPTFASGFVIEDSVPGSAGLSVPPDLALCDDCLREVLDEDARRHRYPFTCCTRCGPRFTITREVPYARANTSMAAFPLCADCAREHGDRGDRRFHAEPLCCPRCGPTLRLTTADGCPLAHADAALAHAVTALLRGEIVALKGIGGFQLLVRADDEAAVQRLRQRKRRARKPLALLVADRGAAAALVHVDDAAAAALRHLAAPIVLLPRRPSAVAASVAPGQHRLGVMLPASALHALLARGAGVPLVCTSGNLHGEPICTTEEDARARLSAVADAFLVHDRAILRRADDSVVMVVAGRMRTLRMARGLSPCALPLPSAREPLLALGGHLKHAPALAHDGHAVLWPHVGDLHSPRARDAMVEAVADLERFLGVRAATLVTDLHPDYATTRFADDSGRRVVRVQHHHAHVAAVLAEHGVSRALGFAWDGVGLGEDGLVWGGEALFVQPAGARRVAHLQPFPLPGGDAAARDGKRALAGLMHAAGLSADGLDRDIQRYARVARSPRLAPLATSVGRLFDAVAALTGVCEASSFEGEAAMALEAIAHTEAEPYPLELRGAALCVQPMVRAMLAERHDAVTVASRFHATLSAAVVELAGRERAEVVALAGGCFQNALLLEATERALSARGVRVLSAERVPPGDGGLALGQAWIAAHGM